MLELRGLAGRVPAPLRTERQLGETVRRPVPARSPSLHLSAWGTPAPQRSVELLHFKLPEDPGKKKHVSVWGRGWGQGWDCM